MTKRLFTRDFALLWFGKSISQLGDGAGFIGLMWWIQSHTGSATALGLLAAVSTLIRVVLAPFSGVLADRVSKKAIIVLMDVIRGLLYCLLAYLAFRQQLTLPLVLALSAANTLCSVFFGPAISATVPLLVEPDNLPKANSFLQMTGTIVQIISYTAGGVLVAVLGIPLLFLIDGISFLLSALSEVFIYIPSLIAKDSSTKQHFMQNVREGFSYVKSNAVLFDIMKVAAVLNFAFAPIFILLPKYVNDFLGAPVSMYGYLLASMTLGTLLASLLIAFTRVVQRNVWLVMQGITLQALLMIALVVVPRYPLTLHIGIFLISGFLNGIVNIYFSSLLQRFTAKEHMGKVFGLLDAMCGALQPASQSMSGVLGDKLGVGVVYVAAGSLGGLGGVKFSLIPNLREWLKPEDFSPLSPATTAPSTAD